MAGRTKTKAKLRAQEKDKRPRAIAKNIRISPYKVRAVLDVIRGKNHDEARALLKSLNKSSCDPVLKVLNSALANAENNYGYNVDDMYLSECYADQGPTLKRMMPKAKGRGSRILKRTSHITIILDSVSTKTTVDSGRK
ncbi:MAG: 50S ribosomal protein L22 [Christensenellaceae bacterium]|jgi:large subunit ribosomal protein L22|nr:50S ribosomal protein L22 [Christensenellaceae bacterium]